jgi:Tfp pilus assembly protein PilO
MFTYEKVVKELLRDATMTAGSVVLALILIWFISGQISSSVDKVVANNELNATLGLQNNEVAQLRGQYLHVADNENLIRAALLPSDNVLEFVTALESIASKDGVTQSIHFDVPKATGETISDPSANLEQIAFTLTVQGNIFTFIRFLSDIERLPYFMKIEGMAINATATGGWQNTSNVVLHGTLYTQNIND